MLLPAGIIDSSRFALDLLTATSVAVAPGDAFGVAGRGHVRVSLAASDDNIRRGLGAIAEYLTSGGIA